MNRLAERTVMSVYGQRGYAAVVLGVLCFVVATTAIGETTLNTGDLLFVDVYRRPELSTTVQVDANGAVPLPYIGNVNISGLTEQEAAARIALALKSILKNPRVTVSRTTSQPVMPMPSRTATMKTQVITLNNSNAEVLSEALQGMSSQGGTINYDPNTNTIIITDEPGTVQNIIAAVSQLDQMQSQVTQVRIDTKIAEVEQGAMKELGIRWFFKGDESTGGYYSPSSRHLRTTGVQFDPSANESFGGGVGGISGGPQRRFVDDTPQFDRRLNVPIHVPTVGQMFFGFLDNNVDIGVLLDALMADDKAQLLANPAILTVNHKPAEIKMTDEFPYTEGSQTFGGTSYSVKFMDLGIKLEVTPHVRKDMQGTYVQMELKPEVSYASGVSSDGIPIRSVRSSDTVANVRDGQTLVIGGIILSDEHTTVQAVPGISKIPVLGALFKRKERSRSRNELMVFVTPTVHEAPESITWDRMINLSESVQGDLALIPSNEVRGEARKE